MKTLVAAVALSVAVLPEAAHAEDRTVLVVEGDKAPRIKAGDILRFTQSGAAGRSEITATVAGDARLLSTTDVRRYRDGRPLIGAVTREFEVKALRKGTAVVTVTVKDLVDRTTRTKEYRLDIAE
jgi:hypothetical protein